MKVLWLSQNLPYPPKTGVLQRNYNLIREASAFADVHLVAIVKQDILPTFDEHVAERELAKLCATVTSVHLPIEQSRVDVFVARLQEPIHEDAVHRELGHLAGAARRPSSRLRLEGRTTSSSSIPQPCAVSCTGERLADGPQSPQHRIASAGAACRIREERAETLLPRPREPQAAQRTRLTSPADFDTNLVVSRLDGERLQRDLSAATTAVLANGVDVDYFRRQSPISEVERGHLIMVSGMNWFPNRDAVLLMAEIGLARADQGDARRSSDHRRRESATRPILDARRARHARHRNRIRRRCAAVYGAGAGVSVPHA